MKSMNSRETAFFCPCASRVGTGQDRKPVIGIASSIDNTTTHHHTRQTGLINKGATMRAWQLQDAKSRFSELVECALNEGPQLVTKRGNDAVVLMAAPEYRRLAGEDALVSLLLQAPRGEPLDTTRSPESIRPLDLA